MLKTQKPKVSVVIPMYNGANTVERCLESVERQTYPNIECIVVDDGSEDRGGEVVGRHPQVAYAWKSNGGAASARNSGVAMATGDYFAFLDVDDFWHPQKLELQVNALGSRGFEHDLIYSLKSFSSSEKTCRELSRLPDFSAKKVREVEFKAIVEYPYIGTSTILVSRDRFEAMGGYDSALVTAEDVDFYFRFLDGCNCLIYEDVLTFITRLPGGLSSDLRTYSDNLEVLRRFQRDSPEIAEQYACELDINMRKVYDDWVDELLFRGLGVEARKVLKEMSRQGLLGQGEKRWFRSYLAPIKKEFRELPLFNFRSTLDKEGD